MIVLRIFLGLLKGVIVGGALGYGFFMLPQALHGSAMKYLLYGLIGAVTGFVAGKAVWKQETIWTSVVKAVFGLIVGVGLYALAAKLVGDPKVGIAALGEIGKARPLTDQTWLFGPAVAVVYGIFVEIDDGGTADEAKAAARANEKTAAGPDADA